MEKRLSCELSMYHSLKSSVPRLISLLIHPSVLLLVIYLILSY